VRVEQRKKVGDEGSRRLDVDVDEAEQVTVVSGVEDRVERGIDRPRRSTRD
jgi:hypothetical protein